MNDYTIDITNEAGLKFRKIKAKSITEALPKLADWFYKNADKIV